MTDQNPGLIDAAAVAPIPFAVWNALAGAVKMAGPEGFLPLSVRHSAAARLWGGPLSDPVVVAQLPGARPLLDAVQAVVRRNEQALNVALEWGAIDGEHHKMWVIDQIVRALTGSSYSAWMDARLNDGLSWDEGIAP